LAKEFKNLYVEEMECNSKLMNNLKEYKQTNFNKNKLHEQTQLMAKRIVNETHYISAMISNNSNQYEKIKNDIDNLQMLTERMKDMLD